MAYTTINKSTDYFNTKLYTGTGSSNALTGIGFQPDLVWLKGRSNATWHWWTDAVRGNTKNIFSNSTQAEGTNADGITAFGTDGFTLGTNTDVNGNGNTFVSWNFKANGAGSANTDGTASNVTVSANTTAGFSIVQFDATQSRVSVGHGLGVVPDVIIMKETEGASGWIVGGFGQDWSGYLSLSSSNAFNNDSNDSTGTGRMFTPDGYAPTASVWSTNGSAFLSGGTKTCIAYCFAEKTGYSKFGSYTGNGNDDGTFVYTGFKPAFVMVKASSGIDQWQITDHKRDANVLPNFARVTADSNGVEATNQTWAKIEKFSNGFKLRGTDGVTNQSGRTYVYMAFAEAPLVGSNNIPCTAR